MFRLNEFQQTSAQSQFWATMSLLKWIASRLGVRWIFNTSPTNWSIYGFEFLEGIWMKKSSIDRKSYLPMLWTFCWLIDADAYDRIDEYVTTNV